MNNNVFISQLSRSALALGRAEDGPALLRHGWKAGIIALFLLIGCAETKPTTQPATWADQAEADPANFNPKMDDPNISGGDIGHFDKNAFDKDLNDVLNP